MNTASLRTHGWTVVGSVAVTLLVMFYGGFAKTSSSAEAMAAERGEAEVVKVLAPICAVQAQQDPAAATKLAELAAESSYGQSRYVIDAGWASIANVELSSSLQRKLADGCRIILLQQKPA